MAYPPVRLPVIGPTLSSGRVSTWARVLRIRMRFYINLFDPFIMVILNRGRPPPVTVRASELRVWINSPPPLFRGWFLSRPARTLQLHWNQRYQLSTSPPPLLLTFLTHISSFPELPPKPQPCTPIFPDQNICHILLLLQLNSIQYNSTPNCSAYCLLLWKNTSFARIINSI